MERSITVETLSEGAAAGESVGEVQAFETIGPSRGTLSAPCFRNFWQLDAVQRLPNNRRRDTYIVVVQCLAGQSGSAEDVKADLAVALWEAFLSALDANLLLSEEGGIAWQVRGTNDEMPMEIEIGGGFIGWECELDLILEQFTNYGVGAD